MVDGNRWSPLRRTARHFFEELAYCSMNAIVVDFLHVLFLFVIKENKIRICNFIFFVYKTRSFEVTKFQRFQHTPSFQNKCV